MENKECRNRTNVNKKHRKKRRRHRRKSLFFIIIVVGLVSWGWMFFSSIIMPPSVPSVIENSNKEKLNNGVLSDGVLSDGVLNDEILNDEISSISVDLEHLYSPYAILIESDSGNTLAKHDAEVRIYPASLTKIMTAVLAVENIEDMEEVITLPTDFFQELYAENASMAGFEPGERVRLKDLLYGVLLPSGAECCMAFADIIAGSEEDFVYLMNQKAAELGMENTHFCNATGLHEPEHYSTVEDISILLRYALKYENFKAAFTSSRHSTLPSDQHPDGFTFHSTMFKYMDSTEVIGGEIIGGKTGYTEEAGLCLASLAKIGGKEYILVTAKASGSHNTEQFHIMDAINVYNQIGEQEAGR